MVSIRWKLSSREHTIYMACLYYKYYHLKTSFRLNPNNLSLNLKLVWSLSHSINNITLPFWQLLHPPAWLLNRARMAILLRPYDYSSQARMAFILIPYGYSSEPVWLFFTRPYGFYTEPVWLFFWARMAITSVPVWHAHMTLTLKKELHMHPILHMMISPVFHGTVGTLYQNQHFVPIINLFRPYGYFVLPAHCIILLCAP